MKILAIQGSSLNRVNFETDTTFFLALEAQKRGYHIYYFEPENLSFINGSVFARCTYLKLYDDKKRFFKIIKKLNFNLINSKIILIRNEPPFNQKYINTTFILEHLSKKIKIVNHPKAIREVPEKLFSINFIKYMPSTLISEDLLEIKKLIKRFIKKHNHIIFQKFLSKVSEGDKRVFIINGKIKGLISRVPKKGSILSNMSKGAHAILNDLTAKEKKISMKVARLLKQKQIYFAGIDFVQEKLIGDINVTSPTGLKTYFKLTNINLAKYFWDNI